MTTNGFIFFFLVSTDSPCDVLKCQHLSPCMVINELSSNGTYKANAKCQCIGSYAGRRCEHKLSILESSVTTSSISFTVYVSLFKPMPDSVQYVNDDVTIHYWQNYSQSTCSIFAGKLGTLQKIPNLLSDTVYTLCVVGGHVNYCSLKEHLNSSLSCKEIITPVSDPLHDKLQKEWIIPVIIVCGIMVIFSGACLCHVINCRKREKMHHKKKRPKEKSRNGELDFFLPMGDVHEHVPNVSEGTADVPTFPKLVPVVRPPKSPGRLPYKISEQNLGYSSFTLRNSKSYPLKTVFEYSGEQCPNDEIGALIPPNKENI